MPFFCILIAIYVVYGTAEASPTNNECSPDSAVRLNIDCSKFDVCNKGRWATRACNEGDAFDPIAKICVQANGCIACEKKINDPDNCRGFFACQGSRRVRGSCNQTQIFNSDSGECVNMELGQGCIAEEKSHHKKVRSIADEKLAVANRLKEKNAMIDHGRANAEFRGMNCEEGELQAIPGSCSTYLMCNEYGTFVPRDCFWFFHFNPISQKCEFFYRGCN